MKELLIRSISGLVLGGVVLACILVSPLTFAALALLICAIGTYEMARLQGVTHRIHRLIGEALVIVSYIVAALVGLEMIPTKWLLLELLFPLLTFLMALFSKRYDFKQLSTFALGSLLFLALPMSLMVFMYRPDLFGDLAGARIIILIFCLLWTNDIFAYLTGRLFGRNKLFERISPGKTIEGSFGGLLFTSIGIAVFCHYTSWLPVSTGIGLGLIAVIFGTLGDLCESMLKRQAGVKDSGKLIPGHGGILDRFDSILFSVPFVFVFLLLI
jgi:phosphatidate cytidylyltransferase